jgi:hypothetical protein
MARPIRVDVEGGEYHVISRGIDRHDVFRRDVDWIHFLDRLEEINAVSSYFYADQFVGPYYKTDGLTLDEMQEHVGLTYVGPALAKQKNLKIITNADDFILGEEGLAWLRATVGDRLTTFPTGGHLGNLWDEKVQQQIIEDLVR